jgi:alcohol dehydrogenase (cytochrome c)
MTSSRRPRFQSYVIVGVVTGAALIIGALDHPAAVAAQGANPRISYTPAQARRGEAAYIEHCESCHGRSLDDGPFAPALKGVEFRQKWTGRSMEDLFTLVSTKMPPARPGTLGDSSYAALLAYILQENGTTPGAGELSVDGDSLKTMGSPGFPRSGGGGLAPNATIPPPPAGRNPLDSIRPVTEAMLTKVEDGEWLSWRRTYDATGFSPLKKINRSNVDELRVAWTWTLPRGPNESTPIVHDGVLFVHGYGDSVQALDAATGDLLWQYSRRLPTGVAPTMKRGIAIYGSRLYVPTSDGHMLALDVKTGRVIWDQAVADPKAGYRITGGPLVARGRVMIGTMGRAPGGNLIAALDADTGKEAWRFYTIARPDEAGGNTWNGLALEQRNGASVWIPPSYDPVQNLVLFGTGNTYDTGPLRDAVDQRGVTNDGLYLDSTLALNPVTGKLAWHFQHQANGQWDLDWAFERMVVQLPVNGDLQSVVVTAGKQMIFDFINPETGKYLSSIDLGLQNGIIGIDPKTGAKTQDPQLIPGDGQTKMICPHASGGRGWIPTAYDAASKVLFLPMVEACMDLVPVPSGERGFLSTGVRPTVRPRPGSDGKYGRLQAIDLQTQKTVWVERQRAPYTTGALVTAGGLVFAGSLDRMINAYDSETGAPLWQTRLNDVPSSAPISYSANGQEYVAIVVGPGRLQSSSYNALVPEIKAPPEQGAAIWVFELPKKRR